MLLLPSATSMKLKYDNVPTDSSNANCACLIIQRSPVLFNAYDTVAQNVLRISRSQCNTYIISLFPGSAQLSIACSTAWERGYICNIHLTSVICISFLQAEAKYPKDSHLFQRCFDGVFILHLLQQGFGFTSNTTHTWTVTFKSQVSYCTRCQQPLCAPGTLLDLHTWPTASQNVYG